MTLLPQRFSHHPCEILFIILTCYISISSCVQHGGTNHGLNIKSTQQCLLPRLTKVKTIVNLPQAHLRDPSSPLFDDGLWHFWATYMKVENGPIGRLGRVHHFYAEDLEGPWNTSGVAIEAAKASDQFDHAGTFTPSSFKVKGTGEWILFYSGVRSNTSTDTR